MRLVCFLDTEGVAVYINPEHVILIEHAKRTSDHEHNTTRVSCTEGYEPYVQGEPSEVAALLMGSNGSLLVEGRRK